MQFTRLMDMLMVNEASIELVARSFLDGDYVLDLAAAEEAAPQKA